jgi:predicted phosphoribosyltransferase
VNSLRIRPEVIARVAAMEWKELRRRERAYRGDCPAPCVRDTTVILVDDGLATGTTMRTALEALRRQAPRRIVVAVPIAAPDSCLGIQSAADDVICARIGEPFHSVGRWYQDFSQTTDREVRGLLECARAMHEG